MSSKGNIAVEEHYRILAETVPALVWIADSNNDCNFYNTSWLNYTGLSLEQQIKNGWLESLHPDDKERVLAASIESLASKQPYRISFRLKRSDGAFRWFLMNVVPRFDTSRILKGFICSCTDIQDLKDAETAQNEFINLAGHEIRTPLTILTVSTQMLETLTSKEEQSSYIPELLTTMRGSLKKLDDLLDEFIQQIANKKIE